MATDLVGMFTSIGLSEQKATETLKNEQLAKFLKEIIVEVSKALHWTDNTVYLMYRSRKIWGGFDICLDDETISNACLIVVNA